MKNEWIAIIDFGGQYTQLIAKRVRHLAVYSEIVPHTIAFEKLRDPYLKGIILSGGPESLSDPEAPRLDPQFFQEQIPILGICYGMQLLNVVLGGRMEDASSRVKEYGETVVSVDNENPLFCGIPDKINTWMSHGDSVDAGALGEGLISIAKSKHHVVAIAHKKRPYMGVQFHPEVTHTQYGIEIISRFVHGVCQCSSEWNIQNYVHQSQLELAQEIEGKDILSFVSGGVDSTYVTALLAQIPKIRSLHAVYIEGLMRKGETDEVERSLKAIGVKNLKIYRAQREFIHALKGVQEPEEKRKIIGNLFGTFQEKACVELGLEPEKTLLAQGTLYTDLIESGKGVGTKAHTIKTHHNVGCAFIEKLKQEGRIVEPNKWIFKDEVREAARNLGLPPAIWKRQPFPGPGLALRIVGGREDWIGPELYALNKQAQAIAGKHGFEAWVLPIKTVGVQGDGRTYSYLVLLRGPRDWKRIRDLTKILPMELHEVNRVVYELNLLDAKPIYMDRLVPTMVTEETVELLQNIDLEGRDTLAIYGYNEIIDQTIFVLFGADLYGNKKRAVAIRLVQTDDFMTVNPVPIGESGGISWDCLEDIGNRFKHYSGIGAVVLDVTDKPPATTEWE